MVWNLCEGNKQASKKNRENEIQNETNHKFYICYHNKMILFAL